MNHRACWKLGCVILLLCSACGDDEQATDEPGVTRGDGSVARPDDEGDPTDDESGGRTGTAGSGGGARPTDGGEAPMSGSGSPIEDAAAPPPETAGTGGTEEPGDAAVLGDAGVEVDDCESLAACCERLRDRPQTACENAIEAADDAACAAFGRRACPGGRDGGMPTRMTCEAVLECCAGLEGREQSACEAAASGPEGQACDRAVERFCR